MIQKVIRTIKRHVELLKEKSALKNLSNDESELISNIKDGNLTYLTKRKLASLVYSLNEANASNLEGLIIEAGCALGGSAILMAKLKNPNTSFQIYDVFGMIPSPTIEDTKDVHERYKIISEGKSIGIKGETYYGYEEDLLDKVIKNLKAFNVIPDNDNVILIKGLVQETMNINEPVVLAHVDVDWYEPVKTCLDQICPNLVIGGSIILDDYHYWGGCRKATDEYFKGLEDQYHLDDRYDSMKATRIK